jgi:trk system potassium uptake protein TrkA
MTRKAAVIGLGKFGTHLAIQLAARGAEVLAIDDDLERLDDIKDTVAHTVRLDSTEEKAMREQGLDEYDAVVVGMGDDFEASLLTVAVLQKLEVKRIIVRATTSVHERILNHLGIKEVILPAEEAAERLATSLMVEGALDSFALTSDYKIMEVTAPDGFIGRTLEELQLIERFGVNLVTIKRIELRKQLMGLRERAVENVVGIPRSTTEIERGDVLVVFGKRDDIERMIAA